MIELSFQMILLTVINIDEWTKVQLDNFAMIIIWFDTDVSENLSRKNENLSILNSKYRYFFDPSW